MTEIRMPQRHINKIENVKKILEILAQDENIIFRGGTALSLTYEAINRYSEDIDISLMNMSVKSPTKLKEWLVSELDKCSWVTSIEWIEENGFLNVGFDNVDAIEVGFEAFVDNIITIEMPKGKRKPEEVPYSKTAPFRGAMFEMNVMKLENIFSDKISIVFEYFMRHGGFSWVELNPKLSRHIYDVQMLLEKDTRYQIEHIKRRMHKFARDYILFPNAKHIENGADIVKGIQSLTNVKCVEIFVSELNKSWGIIESGVSKLVYPDAKKLSKKAFIKGYEDLFRKLLTTLKEQRKIQEDEIKSSPTSL